MRALLLLGLVALVATGALAQTGDENMLGLFFTDDLETISSSLDGVGPNPYTNVDTDQTPFDAYIVLLNPTVESICSYEVGLQFSDLGLIVTSVSGPNGWTNYGINNLNHRVGYSAPLPCANGAVLCVLHMIYLGVGAVDISFHAPAPGSFDYPCIVPPDDLENIIPCTFTVATDDLSAGAVVATLNGDGVVATETHSLSDIKALFD